MGRLRGGNDLRFGTKNTINIPEMKTDVINENTIDEKENIFSFAKTTDIDKNMAIKEVRTSMEKLTILVKPSLFFDILVTTTK